MEIMETIQTLTALYGTSGFEHAAADKAVELMRPWVDEVSITRLGSVIGVRRCGKENAKKLLLDAHLDEVGLIVTGVEEGFLRFRSIGGVDPRMLPDAEVLLMTRTPSLGVITCLPPHVQSAADHNKAVPISDLRIDVGMTQEEAEKAFPIGTPIGYRSRCFAVGENQLCGKTMDDRSCFAILLRTLELLYDTELDVDLYVMGSTREEVGGEGAQAGTFAIHPDYCVAVDVTHGNTPDAPNDKTLKMGGGPAIGIGPNMTRWMTNRMVEKAKEKGIPYQMEVMSGCTGTNGWDMQISREGVATSVLSLPLKYMHSPIETLNLEDAEQVARLLAAFTEHLGAEGTPADVEPRPSDFVFRPIRKPVEQKPYIPALPESGIGRLTAQLCALDGVSSAEDAVRDYLMEQVKPYADKIRIDHMGNLIVWKKGEKAAENKLMFTAHMDEVGMMVRHITEDGYLKFSFVGGVDRRVVIGKRVFVGPKRIPGVVGLKAYHLVSAEEEKSVPKLDEFYIDIGAKDKKTAEERVSLGDVAVFDSDAAVFGDGMLKAKAIDDRIGCAVMLELIRQPLPMDCVFAFTTQEEVGTRGAFGAAFSVEPEIAVVLEGTTAADSPMMADHRKVCRPGNGPVISLMDGGTIYDRALFERLRAIAEEKQVPWQVKHYISGGTDAKAIQRTKKGVRVTGLSAAVRYLHAPASVASLADMEQIYVLAKALIDSLAKACD